MINHLETDVHTRTLPNPYLGHARDNPGRTRLQKADIRAGYILWLRETVNEDDLRLLSEAGLPRAASGHPVVVIDMLEGQPSHLEICTVWTNLIHSSSRLTCHTGDFIWWPKHRNQNPTPFLVFLPYSASSWSPTV